jgi:pimeloyl-ACP methyl ester carboxylesterase
VAITTHRGCRLYWELDGDPSAPPLLLVRGLARSARYWAGLRELLAPRFRLILVDNRGIGRSDAPRPPYSTALMADDTAAVLDDAGVARAHVFGMSLGGMIVQQLALRHPARVDRLVLGCTSPGGRNAVRFPLRAVLNLVRSGLAPPERALRIVAPYLLSAQTLRERPDVIDSWQAITRAEPPRLRGLIGQLSAAARHDAWERLPGIGAPTLVLTGDADRLIPHHNSRLLAQRIAGARLQLIAGAGHDFAADRPAETAAALTAFLEG